MLLASSSSSSSVKSYYCITDRSHNNKRSIKKERLRLKWSHEPFISRNGRWKQESKKLGAVGKRLIYARLNYSLSLHSRRLINWQVISQRPFTRHEKHSNRAFKGLFDSLPSPTGYRFERRRGWNVSLVAVNLFQKRKLERENSGEMLLLVQRKTGRDNFESHPSKQVSTKSHLSYSLSGSLYSGLVRKRPRVVSLYKFDRSICIFNHLSLFCLFVFVFQNILDRFRSFCVVINAFWFITLEFWQRQLKSLK